MDFLTEKLVLPEDVLLVPVSELSPLVARQLGDDVAGEYAISRLHGRSPSKLIDANAARLLEQFRQPRTVVEAVVAYSRATRAEPEKALEDAFPLVQMLVRSHLLAALSSEHAAQIAPSCEIGDSIDGFEVLTCVQLLDDSEVYKVLQPPSQIAALKLVRPGAKPEVVRRFAREASVLRRLDGTVNARLLKQGTFVGREYLAIEWWGVLSSVAAAQQALRLPGTAGRAQLLEICCGILDAYAHLHAQGIVHADIHPRNILVLNDAGIRIIDYGLARAVNEAASPERGGVGFFFEPEFAQALAKHRKPPAATFAGEQYSLAALLFQLITGEPYLNFSAQREKMLRQIAEEHPPSFLSRGIKPWPKVEEALSRALSKDPSKRFLSVAEFAVRMRSAGSTDEAPNASLIRQTTSSAGASLLAQWLQRAEVAPGAVTEAPTSSINLGMAGLAYTFYRLACLREDSRMLASADQAAALAAANLDKDEAFYSSRLGMTKELVGPVSLYHTASGIHCVRAMIAQAMGDMVSCQKSIDAFIQASSAPCSNPDLTLGRASTLIGCSLILGAVARPSEFVQTNSLLDLGNHVLDGLWCELDSYGPIVECTEFPSLGIAHGWGGVLYATLSWCGLSKANIPVTAVGRLAELAQCAEPAGRGIRWAWKSPHSHNHPAQHKYMSGWCNGSAGMAHLFTLAHRRWRDARWADLAERSAWNAWEELDSVGDLCCGYAGRAYAQLNLYRHTGASEWLERAHSLTELAAASIKKWILRPESLYKGEAGVALLAADLANPELSAMPMFEPEGWPID